MKLPVSLRNASRRVLRRAQQANHWAVAKLVLAAFAVLKTLPVDKALNATDRLARRIGPLTGRHRIAMDNLRRAYPEKTEAQCQEIALDMWGNMARLAVEYVFLDQLYDYDFETDSADRVEVKGREIFLALDRSPHPRIFFTAHCGNFEMFPIAASSFGLEIASLFRAPNNPYIADQVSRKRRISGNRMVPSKAGAAFVLARILEAGGNVGALVDQKFTNGVPTTFFGRPCETSPLVPRLARQYEADIYPARCVRLPGNRYRLELLPKVEPPRDAAGLIDADAMCQVLNDIVEGWVREHPGQWMWFHRRWDAKGLRQARAEASVQPS
jgi:KDO2-lipid IV(A) lauroyltransferase